jgi:hypothetical protein
MFLALAKVRGRFDENISDSVIFMLAKTSGKLEANCTFIPRMNVLKRARVCVIIYAERSQTSIEII